MKASYRASARAGEIPIDISSFANEPWTYLPPACNGPTGINNGYTFPTGSQNFGGVPLSIPTGPNNYWNAAAAANCGSGTVSLTIPVGVPGVTSAFTLLNTMWGQPGPQAYLFITFKGSNGATVTYPLVGGVNVRNFNIFPGGSPVTINNTSTIQAWTNGMDQTLDRQEYILPPALAGQVLTSVTITDTGNNSFSRAIFSALTVSTCHAYVTEGITISSGPITYHPGAMLYTQDVTLSNTSSTAVTGPFFLILEDLASGVSITNESRPTSCYAPIGSPSLIALPEGSSLAPKTMVDVSVKFSDPSGAAISYTPLTIIGIP